MGTKNNTDFSRKIKTPDVFHSYSNLEFNPHFAYFTRHITPVNYYDFQYYFRMATEHAIVTHKEGSVTLKPASPGAKTKVNGLALTDELTLKHHDRIVFGNIYIC